MNDVKNNLQAYLDGKAELNELLGLDPAYLNELRGRAQFFIDGGHVERALIMLDMLEELDRTDPTPALIAIDLLLKEGRSDGAEERIGRLRERFGQHPEVDVAEAELKIAIGELVPAAALLRQVIAGDPSRATPAAQRAAAVAAGASRAFEKA